MNEILETQNTGSGKIEVEPAPVMSVDDFAALVFQFQKDLFRSELNVIRKNNYLNKDEMLIGNKHYEDLRNLSMFRISSIRYRKPEDIRQALKVFYSSAHHFNFPLVYLLRKSKGEVSLYLGCRLKSNLGFTSKVESEIRFGVFRKILGKVLPGYLPGVQMEAESEKEISDVLTDVSEKMSRRHLIIGVPAERDNKNNEGASSTSKEQQGQTPPALFGIERVIDAIKDDFAIVGYSEPLTGGDVDDNRKLCAGMHDFFHLMVKCTEQVSQAIQEGVNIGVGTSSGVTISDEGTSTTTSYSPSIKKSLGMMFTRWWKGGEHARVQNTINKPGDTNSEQITKNAGINFGKTDTRSISTEKTNELARYTESILTQYLKRLDKGLGIGMWRNVTQVMAADNLTAQRVSDVLTGFLSGESSSISPVKSVIVHDEAVLPFFDLTEICKDTGNPFGREFAGVSTMVTSDELALLGPIPFQEVPGVIVEKLTDYGRNQLPLQADEKYIAIGKMIDHEEVTLKEVFINTDQIQRHCFVTGATGSGKSNTMRHLVKELWGNLGIPFLVIEPIKREYRMLKTEIKDLEVLTFGKEDCNFSLNPFDVEEELGLVPHIDNLKAAFNASMGNYSSMPYILEDIIYRAYQECGWDLETGKNIILHKLKDAGLLGHTVPIMSDLLPLVETSIKTFFPQQTDYGNSLLGALRARISSMTRGAKGAVLNRSFNSIPMEKLLSKPCVIELWPFTDNEEKAFVMALILIKLYEYRQKQDICRNDATMQSLNHVLIIEEAHRLLSKPQQSGEHSASGRQKAVEYFADILAEIRAYGQGIVIVDQIPSKLIPDVLKNTDVKIAHRLADKEDRSVLGATMNLDEEQMKDLARMDPGQAAVYFGGLRQAVKIQVNNSPLR